MKRTIDNSLTLSEEGDVNFSAYRKQWHAELNEYTASDLADDEDVFIHQSLSTPCLDVLESCEGIYLVDTAGKRYMDFHGNCVHQVGYRNHYVIQKIKQQLDILPFSPRRFTNKPAIDLGHKLTSLLPAALNKVLFCPGGTSAIGMALKLARRVTGKHKVVSLEGSFHGASLDAIAVGGEEQFKKYMGPLDCAAVLIPSVDTYRQVSVNELTFAEKLEEVLKQDTEIGAFLAETIRNTDVQVPSAGYWKRIREICDRYKVLLILDEIPIAFGRTGKMFAFEHFGIIPDIICLGKGLGAGVIPMAAIVTKEEYNIAADISLGHYTHEKNPLGSVAALAMIEFIEKEALLDKVKQDEWFMKEQLNILQQQCSLIGDIRGLGLLWAIELVNDRATKARAVPQAERIMYACLKAGLSFKVSKGNVLQLCPPLIIKRDELLKAIDILKKAINFSAAV